MAPVSTYRLQLRPGFGFADVGNLAGYLSDLGVSHVYLSPILQAVPDSRHGYDVTDHSQIRAEFGGPAGLRDMVTRLTRHGLKIVADIVPNHMATAGNAFQSVLKDGRASPYSHWFDIEWQDGKVAGFRRFFDVSSLVALRAEDPAVFEATHRVILDAVRQGLVDGLRVDHPDGLADPRGYFGRLRSEAGTWIVAEKILVGEERLPEDWACDGTTGYDALNLVTGLFVDPAGRESLIDTFVAHTGAPRDYGAVVDAAKRHVIDLFFAREVDRLARAIGPCDRAALVDLLVAMPVYRAYVVPGQPPPERSLRIVSKASPDPGLTERILHGNPEAIIRFQQTCGPVMAKGVEDTALYRWYPLACLNEVGGEPDRFGIEVTKFHEFCLSRGDATMNALSTHDTKRSEDVRARIAVLSEMPEEWAAAVDEWSSTVDFDPALDYLAWQTLVGACPISRERFAGYLLKAAREAKTATSWVNPDPSYEQGLRGFAVRALSVDVGSFAAGIERYAMINSLGHKLVQLMMPGVPDVYQGTEITDFSLVDPDNRRPVEFGAVRTPWDMAKRLVTTSALHVRRRLDPAEPYIPMRAEGSAADHVIAFARGTRAIAVATRLPVGLERRGGWGSTSLPLPDGRWRDVLTGVEHVRRLPLGDIGAVALLEGI